MDHGTFFLAEDVLTALNFSTRRATCCVVLSTILISRLGMGQVRVPRSGPFFLPRVGFWVLKPSGWVLDQWAPVNKSCSGRAGVKFFIRSPRALWGSLDSGLNSDPVSGSRTFLAFFFQKDIWCYRVLQGAPSVSWHWLAMLGTVVGHR